MLRGTSFIEAKEALQTVYYAYSYAVDEEIADFVEASYDYVEPIMHEQDEDWLTALVLGKGRKIKIVFLGANEEDVRSIVIILQVGTLRGVKLQ